MDNHLFGQVQLLRHKIAVADVESTMQPKQPPAEWRRSPIYVDKVNWVRSWRHHQSSLEARTYNNNCNNSFGMRSKADPKGKGRYSFDHFM
uniref:Uncharacterized protein n=1 Tax=Trichuris muris TaxID=70415 RepID=A0A5S6Q6D4_TRIMR